MVKELRILDIVLSIYNQEKLIERVIHAIFQNTTTPFNLILIFDGCTDRTEIRTLRYIKKYKSKLLKNLIVEHAPNVFETRANNIGFKKAQEDFMITLQDDMVINEMGWERRLTYPLRKFDDVIAVTARIAQDFKSIENFERDNIFTNQSGRELKNLSRNIFAVRDSINRGPVAFNMQHLRNMNYLNDDFAPSDLDDADLCIRAWKERKLRCGVYSIDYISRLEWGKTRSKDSTMYANSHISKNVERIKKNHFGYLQSSKHSENIILEEKEVDYIDKTSRIGFKYFLTYPIRIYKKDIKNTIKIYYNKMNLISKNKEKLINFLRFLNTKPGFRRVFYWVHEIRCTPFKPHNFIAVLIDNTFLLGVYDMESSPTWKRMATIGFERNETDLIKKLSNQFDVFIDIGAHIGYFCCLVGKHNPEASIFAFEPSPENFKSLTKNIDINKITKVKTYNVGLSNKSGTATLYGNDAMSSFNFNSFGGQPKIQATIKIETLNSFTKDIPINRRVFIKMDVEAKEYDVLRGANNFIKEIKPIGLLVEICDEWSGGINPHFKDTFDIIHKLGYKSYLIGDQFPLTETNDISKLRGANYLFIRNDLVEDIRKKTKLI